jgi:hypothetical protein
MSAIWVAGLAAGCAPGRIEWATGSDDLRTALYIVERDATTGASPRIRLLLSNGEFGCSLPSFTDDSGFSTEESDQEQALALLQLVTAMCREDARHVVLDLYHLRWEDAPGVYPGDSVADATSLGSPNRWSRAAYLGVEEARVADEDGLSRAYEIVEVDARPLLGDGGEASISRLEEGHAVGHFSFPEANISGDFRATECASDTSEATALFDYARAVIVAGVLTCEIPY